jgi:hypothetical protein
MAQSKQGKLKQNSGDRQLALREQPQRHPVTAKFECTPKIIYDHYY